MAGADAWTMGWRLREIRRARGKQSPGSSGSPRLTCHSWSPGNARWIGMA